MNTYYTIEGYSAMRPDLPHAIRIGLSSRLAKRPLAKERRQPAMPHSKSHWAWHVDDLDEMVDTMQRELAAAPQLCMTLTESCSPSQVEAYLNVKYHEELVSLHRQLKKTLSLGASVTAVCQQATSSYSAVLERYQRETALLSEFINAKTI